MVVLLMVGVDHVPGVLVEGRLLQLRHSVGGGGHPHWQRRHGVVHDRHLDGGRHHRRRDGRCHQGHHRRRRGVGGRLGVWRLRRRRQSGSSVHQWSGKAAAAACTFIPVVEALFLGLFLYLEFELHATVIFSAVLPILWRYAITIFKVASQQITVAVSKSSLLLLGRRGAHAEYPAQSRLLLEGALAKVDELEVHASLGSAATIVAARDGRQHDGLRGGHFVAPGTGSPREGALSLSLHVASPFMAEADPQRSPQVTTAAGMSGARIHLRSGGDGHRGHPDTLRH